MRILNPKSELLNIHPVRYASNLFLKHIELWRYFSVYISNNLFYLTGQANPNYQNTKSKTLNFRSSSASKGKRIMYGMF